MEAILRAHHLLVPSREVLATLAENFSKSEDRAGKIVVQMKQVWNWFQNRRYALRAKLNKDSCSAKLGVSNVPREDPTPVRNLPQPIVPAPVNNAPENVMEFEAKSLRDNAWYDVATFLSHRNFDTSDPEVLVRFSGFTQEEDEWVNVRKHVRQRSLPCEASECVAVLPGDLILCFQEGKEQALYFDAHVFDAQRRRHDIRGCRCRFLVRYDHDQSEEIVPLRKVCRRPETDHRLQQLYAASKESAPLELLRTGTSPSLVSTMQIPSSPELMQIQQKAVENPNRLSAKGSASHAESVNAGTTAGVKDVGTEHSLQQLNAVIKKSVPMEQQKIDTDPSLASTVIITCSADPMQEEHKNVENPSILSTKDIASHANSSPADPVE